MYLKTFKICELNPALFVSVPGLARQGALKKG